MQIKIKDVKELLNAGKRVTVKSTNGNYVPIKKYIEKGILDTWEVLLNNNLKIKVSKEHKFFTNSGWKETLKLIPNDTQILCDNNTYSVVKSVNYIGKEKIVDISVDMDDFDDQCYFGNGMLNHNSGKSLLAAHVLLETQKKDGIAVYIDTEQAQFEDFLRAIGIDFTKLLYVPEYIIENIFELIENIIETTRKKDPNKLVTIVVDSVMGATHSVENESDYKQQGYNTNKSIIISQAMRKITHMIAKERILLLFTNQLRHKMDAMAFGEKWTTSGGKGIPFHSSIRLQLSRLAKIKNKDNIIGIKSKVAVTKSRVGPPFRTADIELYFNRGMDSTASWLKAAKDCKIVKTAGAWSKFGETTFQGVDGFKEILKDDQIKQQIYDQICDNLIMEYIDSTNTSFNIDNNVLEED